MIKMWTYLYMFMIYVLNNGTITFYYIANLTCIATWPKYTIFGWGCHMELLPNYLSWKARLERQVLKHCTNCIQSDPFVPQVIWFCVFICYFNQCIFTAIFLIHLVWYRGRHNRWPVASIFMVGPVKLNKDRPAGPVDILGPLGPATFVSSVSFNIDW